MLGCRSPAPLLALLALVLFAAPACRDDLPVEEPTPTPEDDDDSAPADDDDSSIPDDDDASPDDDDSSTPGDDDDSGPQGLGPLCFPEIWDPAVPGPDYDQFSPVPGSHCLGTNHQSIQGVERVVFVGDSVTVGTPPTLDADFYRSRLTEALAAEFGLEVPGWPWPGVDWFSGTALAALDGGGDFASCAKWGARADDLLRDNTQIEECLPEAERDKTTLVIMTVGGNDIASLTQAGAEGVPTADLWLQVQQWVQDMEDAVEWLVEPGRFPNGVYVIFSNNFEFTDATGDVESCKFASFGGFENTPWEDPTAQESLVVWAMEQYMRIAVETGTDLIWMLEHFCGHGYRRDDPAGRCYRGPDAELWFDLTCIHPNPAGHGEISDMFMAVVQE